MATVSRFSLTRYVTSTGNSTQRHGSSSHTTPQLSHWGLVWRSLDCSLQLRNLQTNSVVPMSTLRERRKGCSFPTLHSSFSLRSPGLLLKGGARNGQCGKDCGRVGTMCQAWVRLPAAVCPPSLHGSFYFRMRGTSGYTSPWQGLCATGHLFSSTSGLYPFCVKTWYLKLSL